MEPLKHLKGKGMIELFMERLKMLRSSQGLTQEAFAKMLNCTREAIASYETGKSTPPVEILIQMADKLKVSLDYLVGRSQIPKIDAPALNIQDDEFFTIYYKLSKEELEVLTSVAKTFSQNPQKR
jgi:transcriptional regulator with XRE-family HTH domain